MAKTPDWDSNPKPPPGSHAVRLGPDHNSLILTTPEGREFPLSPDRDGMDLLLGYLRRYAEVRQGQARESIIQSLEWPPGAKIRFVPPHNSPWREARFFPRGQDFASGEVIAETKQGYVMCRMDGGQEYALPPKHLRLVAKQYSERGKLRITLEDLGL